jgi:transcriptional regulator GlxA family with amidase domain
MADNVTNELLLEHMKEMQARLSALQSDVTDMKADIRGIKGHMISFMETELAQDGALASLATRVERIERRLSLSEG